MVPGKQQKGWGRTWSSPLGSSGVRKGEKHISVTQDTTVEFEGAGVL